MGYNQVLEAKLWVITRFWGELWKEKSKKFGGSFGGRWRVGRNAFYTRILTKEQNERVTVFSEFWDVLEGVIIRKCTLPLEKQCFLNSSQVMKSMDFWTKKGVTSQMYLDRTSVLYADSHSFWSWSDGLATICWILKGNNNNNMIIEY